MKKKTGKRKQEQPMSWLGEAVVAWIKPKIEKEMKEENKKRGIKDRELVDENGGKK